MTETKIKVCTNGKVLADDQYIGRVEREVRQEGSQWRVSWVALDTDGTYLTRQYARKLAVAAVAQAVK